MRNFADFKAEEKRAEAPKPEAEEELRKLASLAPPSE